MVQTISGQDLTLHDVKEKFSLKPAEDEQFFFEWQGEIPEISDEEKRSLDRVKAEYLYLDEYPIPESLVGLVVLSPLLSLAGFYRPPFRVTTEPSVQIAVEDEDEIIKGRIDILVIQKQLWVLVIESKKAGFSLKPGIPQALAYMMASPNSDKPTFGLVTNGSNFIFIKLTKQDTPQYALSDEFSLRRGHDLYTVLSILKRLGALISQTQN
jgi:hypothetical protein